MVRKPAVNLVEKLVKTCLLLYPIAAAYKAPMAEWVPQAGQRVFNFKDGGGDHSASCVQTYKYGFVLEVHKRTLTVTHTSDRGETWFTDISSTSKWDESNHPFEVVDPTNALFTN